MITHTDAQVGRVLEALKKSGHLENTIIVFSSDNGLAVGRHGLMGKQNVYDHAVHVPLIVSGPGIPKDKRLEQLCYIYDMYPTLCDWAGLPTPNTVEFKSLANLVAGATQSHRNHLYFGYMSWQRAIRDRQFKLIEYCVKGRRTTQLFDLESDPHETRNLAKDPRYAVQVKTLRAILQQERVRLNDGPKAASKLARKQADEFWRTYDKG
jgi:arylsulfatase A-like enzyme